MSSSINHPYHLVDESPWPILAAIFAMGLTSGIAKWFYTNNTDLFFIRLILIRFNRFQWWRDISREGSVLGLHSKIVVLGLQWGIVLFIISEVFFFVSFFWAFFHRRLAVAVELGTIWPPMGIQTFNAFSIPLLNTVVLISSGVRVTWTHHSLIDKNHNQAVASLGITIFLGIYFTLLQGIEYYEARFRIADSCYGCTFFIATGFHGLHVIIGTSFLFVCLFRLVNGAFRASHHFGLQAAIWYWHFVDIVWLFLFSWIYCWGAW